MPMDCNEIYSKFMKFKTIAINKLFEYAINKECKRVNILSNV